MYIKEQDDVLKNNSKNLIVSASAGSGKTHVLIEYISMLVCKKKVPIKKILILTFTKAAATEMKERLLKSLKQEEMNDFVIKQIDDLSVSNISTIHSFCEYCLKKYANILHLNENFQIADGNLAKKLKISALTTAIEKLNNSPDMLTLKYAFKDDRTLRASVFEIENMVLSVSDKEKFISDNLENKNFEKAEKIVCDAIDTKILSTTNILEKLHFDAFNFKMSFQSVLEEKDMLKKISALGAYKFPPFPKKNEVSENELKFLKKLKSDMEKFFASFTSLDLDEEKLQEEKEGKLEKALMHLFQVYSEEYSLLKKHANLLDFSDLEQNMLTLSTHELFHEEFEYVFIDEYQDTNSLQEKIVKKVAENCHFVAVGDAKQGIYGFRLASSDIFLRDVENFKKEENSNSLFLQSNFRSSGKILNFVNDIFKEVMTKKTAKIDYFPNSMLNPIRKFKDEDMAVVVDVISADEKEKKDFEIYSVKEDTLESEESLKELETIKIRIDELLKGKIYDPDTDTFRQTEFKDIAILSRSRNGFFNLLGAYLQKNGYPVITSTKKNLLETPEIMVLLNLLKICLHPNDEVALLSVLLSAFGKFQPEQIYSWKKDRTFEELLQDEQFDDFKNLLSTFKEEALSVGYRRAFEKIFDDVNYYAYINAQNDENLIASVKRFLNEIDVSTYAFDLPNLISYFENVEIEDSGAEAGETNAILLTTIHKTKGLEYPIVMIINAGKSLKKQGRRTEIQMDENLGVSVFRYEGDEVTKTIKLLASEIISERKRFQEEMMIFYVALTRAKNKLFIIGKPFRNTLKMVDVLSFDCYFDFIFNTLTFDEVEKFLNDENFVKGDVEFNLITETENLKLEKQQYSYSKPDENIVKEIEEYLNFKYMFDNEKNIAFKNSVTSLTKKYESEDVFFPTSEYVSTSSKNIEIGNAYHLALKVLDFSKINSLQDLHLNLISNSCYDEIKENIDEELLFKNILLLKPFQTDSVFKEQEFVMKDAFSSLVEEDGFNDEIMVQGVVDFFAVKNNGKIVLIDYKYSNEKNPERLVNRYKLQLKLYKKAIVNGIFMEVDEVYLLNLKWNKLIKVEID